LSGPQGRDAFITLFPKHSGLLLPDAGPIPVQIINKEERAKLYKNCNFEVFSLSAFLIAILM